MPVAKWEEIGASGNSALRSKERNSNFVAYATEIGMALVLVSVS